MEKDWNWRRSQVWEEDDPEVGHLKDHALQEGANLGPEIDHHQQERLKKDPQDLGLQWLELPGRQEDQQLQGPQGGLGTQGPLEDLGPLNVKIQGPQEGQGPLSARSQGPLNELQVLDHQDEPLQVLDHQDEPEILDHQEDLQAQMLPHKNNIRTTNQFKSIKFYYTTLKKSTHLLSQN